MIILVQTDIQHQVNMKLVGGYKHCIIWCSLVSSIQLIRNCMRNGLELSLMWWWLSFFPTQCYDRWVTDIFCQVPNPKL